MLGKYSARPSAGLYFFCGERDAPPQKAKSIMFIALALTVALSAASVAVTAEPRQPRMRYIMNGLASGLGL